MFNKKDVSLVDKIEVSQQKVQRSLEVFADAHKTVSEAQNELQTIIGQAQGEITRLQAIVNNASDEYNKNDATLKKLSEFMS